MEKREESTCLVTIFVPVGCASWFLLVDFPSTHYNTGALVVYQPSEHPAVYRLPCPHSSWADGRSHEFRVVLSCMLPLEASRTVASS